MRDECPLDLVTSSHCDHLRQQLDSLAQGLTAEAVQKRLQISDFMMGSIIGKAKNSQETKNVVDAPSHRIQALSAIRLLGDIEKRARNIVGKPELHRGLKTRLVLRLIMLNSVDPCIRELREPIALDLEMGLDFPNESRKTIFGPYVHRVFVEEEIGDILVGVVIKSDRQNTDRTLFDFLN